jgi:hypothetical protein
LATQDKTLESEFFRPVAKNLKVVEQLSWLVVFFLQTIVKFDICVFKTQSEDFMDIKKPNTLPQS